MDSSNLALSLVFYVILIFVITVHEWAHAWTAHKCGDDTAKILGRMTWNPIPHMSLIGTVIIPLVMILGPAIGLGMPFAIIGWGKPVPVNPRNYRNYLRDDVLVSIAGPISNVIITVVALIIIQTLTLVNSELGNIAIQHILLPMAMLSFLLAFFNLMPIPPLDGSHLLRPLLGTEGRKIFDKLSMYSIIILIVLINTPIFDILINIIFKLFALITGLLAPGLNLNNLVM